MSAIPKVFISYAWESQSHQDKVLGLADWFETNGLEVIFDQYDPNPTVTWPVWMEEGLRRADFVVCVCTPSYKRRVEKQEGPSIGLGLQWEGSLIYNSIASGQNTANKFQVVQFDSEDIGAIPTPLAGNNRHVVDTFDIEDSGLENLYRIITNQPRVKRPTRGQLRVLDPLPRTVVPRSGTEATNSRLDIAAPAATKPVQVSTNIKPSRRRINPATGKGTFLERASRMAMKYSDDALNDDNYHEAISLALKAYELDPQNTYAVFSLVRRYYTLQDYEQTIAWAQRASGMLPQDLEMPLKVIAAKHFLGLSSSAAEEGERLFRASDQAEPDKLDFASFLLDLGHPSRSITILESVPEANRSVQLNALLAVHYWFDNRTSDAVDLLESLPKEQFRATDWHNLGVGRAELNRFGLAIEAINSGSRLRQHDQFGSYALAQIYALMSEADTSVTKLRELLDAESVYLRRVETERTFSLIRNTDVFRSFLHDLRNLLETKPPVSTEYQ